MKPKAANRWTEEEGRRLVEEYRRRTEREAGARIKAILQHFPGRTVKAVATKLREQYPDV